MNTPITNAVKRVTIGCSFQHIRIVLLCVAALASANLTHAINVYTVPWDATNATDNIRRAIANAESPSRIILENFGAPWRVSDTIELNKDNMEIWIKGGATVEATADGFQTRVSMFRIAANNVTMRGYANFSDTSGGVATLRMDAITISDDWASRHCISIRGGKQPDHSPYVNNPVIKGFLLKRSGGDGICINNNEEGIVPPYNVVVKDVICEDNYRQGMSVISVNKLTVTACVFKDTGLTREAPPSAGVDIEPSNNKGVLKEIKFIGCEFRNNKGNNVEVNLDKLVETDKPLEPIGIAFDGCLVDGGTKNGMAFFGLDPLLGPTGSVTIAGTEIRDMVRSGLLFGGWRSEDRVSMEVSNTYIINCAQDGDSALASPIFFSQSADTQKTIGDITFTGDCHIHDVATLRTRSTVRADEEVRRAGPKRINGRIRVHPHPETNTTTLDLLQLGNNAIDCGLQVVVGP